MFRYTCKVTRVVDGDTFDCTVDLGFGVFKKIRVRLYGVEAPETRGSEKVLGKHIAKFFTEELCNGEFQLQTMGKGKYGRWLGVIFNDESENINLIIQRVIDIQTMFYNSTGDLLDERMFHDIEDKDDDEIKEYILAYENNKVKVEEPVKNYDEPLPEREEVGVIGHEYAVDEPPVKKKASKRKFIPGEDNGESL